MLNIVALMGRLTEDPELKYTPNNTPVTAFSLAVERSIVPKRQERKTDFIPVVAWRGTAEFVCKHFVKGQMIAVSGALQTRSYTDKQGNKRNVVEVVARETNFCGQKAESGGQAQVFPKAEEAGTKAAAQGKAEAAAEIAAFLDDDSDFPF